MPGAPTSPERRAELSGGISGGPEFYAFATRGISALHPPAKVLDLGCGTGGLGRFLQARFGLRPHGIDLVRHPAFDDTAYASFRSLDLDALDASLLAPGWDFIFAIGLLEYLTNPRQFLRAAATLLRPGGHLLLTSPNPASLRSLLALLRRGEFSAFQAATNPASITPVLAVDALRMFQEAGLATPELHFSNCGTIPGTPGFPWQRLLPRLGGRWFSDDFRVVGSASTATPRLDAAV